MSDKFEAVGKRNRWKDSSLESVCACLVRMDNADPEDLIRRQEKAVGKNGPLGLEIMLNFYLNELDK